MYRWVFLVRLDLFSEALDEGPKIIDLVVIVRPDMACNSSRCETALIGVLCEITKRSSSLGVEGARWSFLGKRCCVLKSTQATDAQMAGDRLRRRDPPRTPAFEPELRRAERLGHESSGAASKARTLSASVSVNR